MTRSELVRAIIRTSRLILDRHCMITMRTAGNDA